ncbi:MAG: AEC family transporter [Clostridia bacterium]|nr:AEC family transporter [Clostridia bacterium]
MDVFSLVLNQMLLMALLIVAGFILRKKNIVPNGAGSILSKTETYLFVPALNLINQINKCTPQTFKENSLLMLYGLVLILVAIGISYPLSRIFVAKTEGDAKLIYRQNVYKYAMAFSNYGFMGNFLILGVWGEEMFFKYTMFTFPLTVFCASWGLYVLIPKEKSTGLLQNLKKGLLTPPLISLVIGILLGLVGAKAFIPTFLLNALDNASKCMGPVAMVLAGVVIGEYDIKKLITNKKVYLASLFRLIIIPAVVLLALKAVGTADEILCLTLVAFACPLGLNTIVYPATYGGETETGASMAVISNILAVITLPLMYYVFMVLL